MWSSVKQPKWTKNNKIGFRNRKWAENRNREIKNENITQEIGKTEQNIENKTQQFYEDTNKTGQQVGSEKLTFISVPDRNVNKLLALLGIDRKIKKIWALTILGVTGISSNYKVNQWSISFNATRR